MCGNENHGGVHVITESAVHFNGSAASGMYNQCGEFVTSEQVTGSL